MIEPMTAERLAHLEWADAQITDGMLGDGDLPLAFHDRRELIGEVKRLNARLAEFTQWEPTVKEEYDHACDVAERAEEAVRTFKREHEELCAGPDQNDAVVALVVALENALEMR